MANTIIAHGITIEGEISAEEELVVQGTIRGKIDGQGIVAIETGALVEADLTAQSASIGGQVTGNVTVTDRVELQSGGRLVGDVTAARITIADGASFKGRVDMDA